MSSKTLRGAVELLGSCRETAGSYWGERCWQVLDGAAEAVACWCARCVPLTVMLVETAMTRLVLWVTVLVRVRVRSSFSELWLWLGVLCQG